MKFSFTVACLYISILSIAQIEAYDEDDFFVLPQKDIYSYSIYWFPSSPYMLDYFKSERILVTKAVLEKGLEKKIIKLEGSKIISIEEKSYSDTLLTKNIRTFPSSKLTEVYYFKYASVNNELISVKGFSKSELIYSYTRKQLHDTTEIKTVYNLSDLQAKERELTVLSKDNSLTKTNILFLDHRKFPVYKIKRFTQEHLLEEEIDSSLNEFSRKKYKYDSIGRVSEIKWIGSDSILSFVEEYKYGNTTNIISSYGVYNNRDKHLSKEFITHFDETGSLLCEETINYDKPDAFINYEKEEKSIPIVGRTMKKYYNNNRLIKVELLSGSEIVNCYEIEYNN
jgi:hypothetical protein